MHIAGALLAFILTITASTQNRSPEPRFEVATVRPSAADAPLSIERRGNRLFVTSADLAWLVKWAFDLDDDRVMNMPAGAEKTRVDIVAQAPEENPARGRMQLMMQTLLRERFALSTPINLAFGWTRDGLRCRCWSSIVCG